MDEYIKITPGIGPIPPASGTVKRQIEPNDKQGFDDILKQKIQERDLKISHHAQMRMASRNIHLTEKQMTMLKEAVNKAEQKGVK